MREDILDPGRARTVLEVRRPEGFWRVSLGFRIHVLGGDQTSGGEGGGGRTWHLYLVYIPNQLASTREHGSPVIFLVS